MKNGLNKTVLVLVCPQGTPPGVAMRLSSYKHSLMTVCKEHLPGEEIFSLRITDDSDVTDFNDVGADVVMLDAGLEE